MIPSLTLLLVLFGAFSAAAETHYAKPTPAPTVEVIGAASITVRVPYNSITKYDVLKLTIAAAGRVTGFRIFINKQDANLDTPLNDIHYMTSVTFFPILDDVNLQEFRYWTPLFGVLDDIASEIKDKTEVPVTFLILSGKADHVSRFVIKEVKLEQ